jgi:CRISPR type I-E-associated protein CasB/Cse2
MTSTEQFIHTLESLKPGDLGHLRMNAGLGLDESVESFDLFAGLWWPLREKNQKAPRREVAWLVCKLYASSPMPQTTGATLAAALGRVKAADEHAAMRRQAKFDELLTLPLDRLEPILRWAVGLVAKNGGSLDWARLADDLSIWEREQTRLKWAKEYLQLAV